MMTTESVSIEKVNSVIERGVSAVTIVFSEGIEQGINDFKMSGKPVVHVRRPVRKRIDRKVAAPITATENPKQSVASPDKEMQEVTIAKEHVIDKEADLVVLQKVSDADGVEDKKSQSIRTNRLSPSRRNSSTANRFE